MDTLTVLEFPTADGAGRMLGTLQDLQKQQLIAIHDAAIVTWPANKAKPQTKQLNNIAGFGALNGAFWGMLFGLLFFVPFLGAAIGAGIGALTSSLVDVGIDDNFIKQVREKVKPGTSALFLLTSGAVVDRVVAAVKGAPMEIVSTNLSADQEQKLRAAFESDEPEPTATAPAYTEQPATSQGDTPPA
jgi:uncharacterized membrane protein